MKITKRPMITLYLRCYVLDWRNVAYKNCCWLLCHLKYLGSLDRRKLKAMETFNCIFSLLHCTYFPAKIFFPTLLKGYSHFHWLAAGREWRADHHAWLSPLTSMEVLSTAGQSWSQT